MNEDPHNIEEPHDIEEPHNIEDENLADRMLSRFPASAVDSEADLMVVYDEEEECPYLPNRNARMPLRFPLQGISAEQAGQLLADGFRRSGRFLYTTNCSGCNECEAIRIDVGEFRPNRSQKRAFKKGEAVFEVEIGEPTCTLDRVQLFNRHRNLRGLNRQGENVDSEEYEMFLAESCLDTIEMAYYLNDRLGGIAICDLADDSISAVYTYYDPDLTKYSPGTYSIMKQIEYCRLLKLDYLYLGYFVAGSAHMSYKQNYRPHQRLRAGNGSNIANPVGCTKAANFSTGRHSL